MKKYSQNNEVKVQGEYQYRQHNSNFAFKKGHYEFS